MRKNSKKILGSALAIMLATTSVCSGMPALKAQSVEYVQEVAQNNVEGKIVLHAKGTGLKIYAWSGTGPLFGAWPGAAMDADATMGDGWCYKEIDADCTGFIICDASGNKLTDDVTDKKAGEYWYADGKFSETNPNGGSKTPEPTQSGDPTPTDTPKPTETPVAKDIVIDKITPADKTVLKAGEKQTITVGATSKIGDGKVYIKFYVTCDGKKVGDSYYASAEKNSKFEFTPEDGKTYEVNIFAQAHDEDNTTVHEMVTYTADKNGSDDTKPEETATPTPDVTDIEKTAEPTKTPDETKAPESTTPGTTVAPTKTPVQTATPTPTNTVKPTNTPKVTVEPTQTPYVTNQDLSLKGSVNKTAVKAGTKVTITANAAGGTSPYSYVFYYKKAGSSKNVTIKKLNAINKCNWVPTVGGTYTLYAKVQDADNDSKVKKIAVVKVNGLTATLKVSKKSPQKKNAKIKFAVKTKNASGAVKYKYTILLAKKAVVKTSYKSGKSFTWKPKKKGTYQIKIQVKDKYTTLSKTIKFRIK